MSNEKLITGEVLKEMIYSGANHLSNKKTTVDNLNVFPVPDGDTGTNMSMTINSASRFISQIEGEVTLKAVCEKVSYGALMGARGNSGVILSQVLAGFVDVIKNEPIVTVKTLKEGFFGGVERAYQAVSNPMEGTILTVVREASEFVNTLSDDLEIVELFEAYLKAGYESLERTPELLPVLKQAGVVDAGGQGYLFFVEGMKLAYEGKMVEVVKEVSLDVDPNETFNHFFVSPEDIQFRYCTEFLLQNVKEDPTNEIKAYLADKGDCTLAIYAQPTVKVHVHTNSPGAVMEYCAQFGELDDIKINNMKSQNQALVSQIPQSETATMAHKRYGIIAVSSGNGMSEIFKSMGVDLIISGGQTMNPSTEDFLNAIDEMNADHIIILPNNKNVILSAEQAKTIKSELDVTVLPTKYLPQGICAMMNFRDDVSLDENLEAMNEMLELVSTGEVTNAVRDTEIGDVLIKAGEYLAIYNGKIIASTSNVVESLEAMIKKAETEDKTFITLYVGKEAESEGEEILEQLEKTFSEVEFELHFGGQEVYHFMLSAE